MSLFGREHLNPGIVIHLPLHGTEMHMPRTNASYVTHMHSLQLQAGQCVGRPGARGWAVAVGAAATTDAVSSSNPGCYPP